MNYAVTYHNANTKGKRVFHTEEEANWFIVFLQSLGYAVDLLCVE